MNRYRILLAAGLFLVLLTAGSLVGRSQITLRDDAEVESLRGQVTRFLDRISYGEVQDAYDDLLEGSPLATQTSNVRKLIDQTSDLETQFGAMANFEAVDAQRIGRDVVLLRYLYKCQRLPVVWHFSFYRAGASDPWKLVSVRFDTDVESLLD